MNKIYKLVWSKVKHCYVVASELAKSHTKAPKSGIISRAVVAGVLACVLSCGAVMPVYSANQTVDGNLIVTGTSGLRGGTTIGTSSDNANLRVNGNETVTGNLAVSGDILKTAIGSGAVVATSSAVAVGANANASGGSIAIGYGADASEYTQAIAIGASAIAKTTNSITIGDHSRNYGISSILLGSSGETGNLYSEIAEGVSGGVLIGVNSVIRGSHSSSLGNYTYIDSASSVALGDYSVAQEDNVISFGHRVGDTTVSGLYNDDSDKVYSENLTRRLINVSDGINDTDVATVGQLNNRTKFVSVNGASTDDNYLGDGATGTDAIAIGKGASATNINSIAIGTGNVVNGQNSGAIGDPSIIDGDNSYSVGNNNNIGDDTDNVFILGNSVNVGSTGEGIVALGNNVTVNTVQKSTKARKTAGTSTVSHSFVAGDSAIIGEENSVAVGYQAKSLALNGTALGSGTDVEAEGGTAVGHNATVNDYFGTAVGYESSSSGEGSSAFGQGANAGAKFATAFGRLTSAQGESSTAIGNNANAVSQSAVAIGLSSVANGGSNTSAVAIGNGAAVGTATQGYGNAVAIGGLSNVGAASGTAIGHGASVMAQNAVALGQGSVANAADTVSVGSASATRKIVNVTTGTADTDASTVGQTGNKLVLSGSTLSLRTANDTVLNSVTLPSDGGGVTLPATYLENYLQSSDDTSGSFFVNSVNSRGYDFAGLLNSSSNYGNTSGANIWFGTSATNLEGIENPTIGMFLDGAYYQNEGRYRVLDTSNATANNNKSMLVDADTGDFAVKYYGVNSTDGTNQLGEGAVGPDAIAIGKDANASTVFSLALGRNASTALAGTNSDPTSLTNYPSMAIGAFSKSGVDGVALGTMSEARSNASTAVGEQAIANKGYSVALGSTSYADEENVVSVGHKAGDVAQYSYYDGSTNYVSYDSDLYRRIVNVADGVNAHDVATVGQTGNDLAIDGTTLQLKNANGTVLDSVVLPTSSGGGSTSYVGINSATGYYNENGEGASGENAIAIGYGAEATSTIPIAIGFKASTALAESASASVAIGGWAKSATNGVAIGTGTEARNDNSTALGTQAIANNSYSVAIGTNSYAGENNIVSFGHNAGDTYQISVADSSSSTGYSTSYSVYSDNLYRRLTHVADGIDDTDVATVGQLKSQKIEYVGTKSVWEEWTDATAEAIKAKYGVETEADYNALVAGSNRNGEGAIGTDTVAIGKMATARGQQTVAIGNDAHTTGANSIAIGNGAVSNTGVAIGVNAKTTSTGQIAIGRNANTSVANGTNNVIAIGNDTNNLELYGGTYTTVGVNSIALGSGALAAGARSYALGNDAVTPYADSVAIGDRSVSGATNTVSFGHKSTDLNYAGNAYGSNLFRRLTNVADGADAHDVATVGQTIELVAGDNISITSSGTNDVGQKKYTVGLTTGGDLITYDNSDHDTVTLDGANGTRLTGLANGTLSASSTDAVNGSQLYATNQAVAGLESALANMNTSSSAGFNVTVNGSQVKNVTSSDNTINFKSGSSISLTKDGDSIKVAVNSDGAVVSGNSHALSGGTVYTEVRPDSDGTYVKMENTTAANLMALDTQVKTNADAVAQEVTDRATAVSNEATIRADADTDLGNRIGSQFADGNYIKKSSTNSVAENVAVLDTQLKSTNDVLNGLDVLAVKYDASAKTNITLEGSSGTTISNVKAGTLSASSTEAVNGSQLYTTNQNLATEITDRTNADSVLSDRIGTVASDGSYIKKSDTNNVAQNLKALDTGLKAATDVLGALDGLAVQYDASNKTKVTLAGSGGTVVDNVKDGTLSATSKEAVNGSQLFKTNQDLATEVTDRINAVDTEKTARENADDALSDRIGTVALDGTYIKKSGTNNVAQNLAALDSGLKATADALGALDGLAVQYDTVNQFKVTLGGSGGTTIDNVKDGVLSATSKEAVNGSQLFQTNRNLAQEVIDRTAAVTAETTARENADNSLSDRIGTVSSDGSYIKKSDTYSVAQNLRALDTGLKTAVDSLGALDGLAVQYDAANQSTVTLGGSGGTTIANVKDGVLSATSNEAVNGSQLFQTNRNLAQEVIDRTTAVTAETTARENADNALSARIGEIAADGNYIKDSSAKNLSQNLSLLDAQVKANADAIGNLDTLAVQYDNGTKDTVTLAGSDGTVIRNVKAGTLSSTSREAVNGSQLFTTNQNLATEVTNRADADTALGNRIDELSGNVVHYDGASKSKVTLEGTGGTTISNVKAGTLSADSTEAVNGSQLYTTNQNLAQEVSDRIDAVNTEKTAREVADTALGERITSLSDGVVHYDDASKTKVTLEGIGGTTISNVKAGTLSATSKEAVNGSQLFKTNQDLAEEVSDRIDAVNTEKTARETADTALGERITSLSDGVVHYDDASKTKVTLEGTGGTTVRNVKAGTLSANSTEAVNGSQLYTTNQNLAQEVSDRTSAVNTEKTAREAADTALGERITSLSDGVVHYDDASKTKVTLEGTGGTTIRNVKAGTLSADSTEAVNSSQLFTTNQNLAQEVSDRIDAVNAEKTARESADAALGGQITSLSDGVVHYDDASKTKVTLEGTGGTTISNVKAGTLSADSTEAINGSQLYTTNQNLAQEVSDRIDAVNAEKTARESADTVLGERITSLSDGVVHYDDASKTKVTLEGTGGTTISNVKAGTLSADSTEAINGSQLYTTNQNLAQEVSDRTSADTALDQKITLETNHRIAAVANEAAVRSIDDIMLSNRIGVVETDKNYIKKSDTNSVSDNLVVLDQQLKTTDADLRTEITERVNAVNAEKTARETADAALSDRIGTVASDGSYIKKSDTNSISQNLIALDTGLKAEKDAREADVRTLTETVSGLSDNAVLYDNALKTRITFSGAGGTKLDNVMPGTLSASSMEAVTGSQLYTTNVNLSNEVVARQGADTVLGNKIAAEKTDRETAVAGVNERIDTEISDREAAVVAEKNAREAADTALGSRVNTEIIDRTTADTVLDNKITAETSARENAVNQLHDAIDELGNNVVRYDNPIKTRVTFAGENGTVLDNVKAGKLSVDSKEAVNGSQLFATNQVLAQKIVDRQNAIAEEKTARETADAALGSRIDTETMNRQAAMADEKTARESADTALGSRIDAEITDRTNADTALDTKIASEKTARESADTVLGNRIDTEITDRTNADTLLDTKITSEISAREAADTRLYEKIHTLGNNVVRYDDTTKGKVTLAGADGTVLDNVKAGMLSADSKEAVNGSQLFTTNQALAQEITDRQNALADEKTARESADAGLGQRIDTEIADREAAVTDEKNAREAADTVLGNRIDTEITDRTNADTVLDHKITAETSARETAVTQLYEEIHALGNNVVHYDDAAKTRITFAGAEGTVLDNVKAGKLSADSMEAVNGSQLFTTNQALAQEIADRQDADAELGRRIDQEYTERVNAVSALHTRIDDESSARQDADAALDRKIDSETQARENAVNQLSRDISELSGNAVKYDDADKTKITLAGEGGTVISNVKAGVVAEHSMDAVNGGQLYEVRQDVGRLSDRVGVLDSNGNYIDKDKSVSENLSLLDTKIQETSDAVVQNKVHFFRVNSDDSSDTNYDGGGATGADAIAVGAGAVASGTDSISFGHGNVVSGDHSGAFGDPNDVSGNGSYVVGNNNTVSGNDSFVLSHDASVTGNNSVVLGAGSDGSQDNVVSVGSAGSERKIVHVADGLVAADSKEAVNGSQLYEVRQDLRDAEGIDTQKWSDALGTGTVADGNTGLVNGGAVYTAIRNMDVAKGTIAPDLDNNQIRIGGNPVYDTVDTINVARSDGSGRVIDGVVTDPSNDFSAANVGYVNAVGQSILNGVNDGLSRLDTKVGKVGASAAAMASLAVPLMEGDEKWAFSAAVGHYDGKTAGALGAFYRPQDNVIFNVRGAVGNGEDMVGAGIGVSLNRGNTPGVSKAELVRTLNAQASKIYEQDGRMARQSAIIQEQNKQIGLMRKQMDQMADTLRKLTEAK